MKESDTTESKLILPLHILKLDGFNLEVLTKILNVVDSKEKLVLLQKLYHSNDTKANLAEQNKKIQNQFSSFNDIIRELVANGIDAVNPDNPIGMFGMGGSLGALKLILNPKKTREEIQEMSDAEKSRYYQELAQNKRNTKLVAINKVVENPINGLIISPQGKTFVMNFDKAELEKYSGNYPDNSTVIAVYPNAETLVEIQKINQKYLSLSEEEFETAEISELETFRFLESAALKIEIYEENNQDKNYKLVKSKIVNKENLQNQNLETVTVRFFPDHFEVINPSENKKLHPVEFYNNLSTKKKEKPENYKLELLEEKNPTIYLLGAGNLIIEKNLLILKDNGIPLISESLTSLKLTLPFSVDASRSEARLPANSDFLENWEKMLTDLESVCGIEEFLKILNTLNLYIKTLPDSDPKQFLKTSYLALVRKLGRETIKKIRDQNLKITVLPNLKGFDRVRTVDGKNNLFVDLDFLESYWAESFLNAFYPNTDIFTKNSNLKLVGVDFEFDNNFSWEDFLKIINDTQNFARSFIYTNKLPILGIFDPKDVTKFTQIWLPKTWLVNLESKYSELKNLYEYEIWKNNQSEVDFIKNEEKESQLQSLNQMEQEYDKIISVLQIICSPKNSYESKFIPPIDFKTSTEIKKEVEVKLATKLAKLENLKQQNSETVANTEEPKSEIQSLKETLLSGITTGKNGEMREVGKTVVNEIFRNVVNEGVSDMVSLVLKWENGYSALRTSHLFVELRLPKVQAGHNTENPSVCIDYDQEGYDFTDICFDDLFDNDYHVTLFDLTLPLIKKLSIFKINNRVDTLIKEIVNNIFIPLSDRVEMTVEWNYQNILEHLKNTDAKLYEEYVILTQKLKVEIENLLDFINGARELEHPDLSQIHFKTNKNEAEEEFCRRDLSGYKFCYIGNLTNQQKQELEVWTYLDYDRQPSPEEYISFIAVKNINTGEINLVDFSLDYNSSDTKNLKSILEIEDNNLLINNLEDGTEKFERMPCGFAVYLIKNNNIPTKKKYSFITYDNNYSFITYDNNNNEIQFDYGVISINDKICKENIKIDGDTSGLHYKVIANSPNGYYLLDGFSGSYMDSYRIRFLPIQLLLDCRENSGEVITPITVFEIPQAKIADDGLTVFSKNPFFGLKGDDENTTSILPLKTLIDNFEEKFIEAEKSEKIAAKIQDYSGEVLKPRFEKFSNFVDDLEFSEEDKNLFLDFCKGVIPLVSFDINDDFQDNETIKIYLNLIKELKTEIVICMKFIKDSDLYEESDEFKNFNLLSNLYKTQHSLHF
jgi:hypothetical protein